MDSFPLFIKLKDQPVLIVGGGSIAWHKTNMLSRAEPAIKLVAPELEFATRKLLNEKGYEHIAREYQPSDLDGVRLVVAATDDAELNGRIAADADQRGILVNAVDMPDLGNCIFPSIVDRSPMIIAVGSGGRSPVLVRLLRARLETLIPAGYGRLSELVGTLRNKARESFPEMDVRRRFWDRHLQGHAGQMAMSGDVQGARDLLEKELSKADPSLETGEVYLVGGGPGDPDLLTFRALRLMQQCDVVLYDRLVSKEVLELVRREAERIYVGKDLNPYSITQENINQALVDQARQGKRVLRLKGGDPFIFGRGGEELSTLAEERIPFQVVPGITAASGCASYAGIPLTHRDHCHSVRFITGHRRNGVLSLDWKQLVAAEETLVFYMSLNGLEEISEKLIEYGMSPDMPAAMVEKGTSPNQRVWAATIGTIAPIVRADNAKAPTLLIVGSVVSLREKLGKAQVELD
jgi:uroporphyrin-III C-methyltransferase/precorrin-2 dehydrogenase/sirohydrochlorin ferrochelatase